MYMKNGKVYLQTPEDVQKAVQDSNVNWLDCRMDPSLETMEGWFTDGYIGETLNLPVAHLGFNNIKEMKSCFYGLRRFDHPFPKGLFPNLGRISASFHNISVFNNDITGLFGVSCTPQKSQTSKSLFILFISL